MSFLKDMFSADKPVSSKRVVAILFSLVVAFIFIKCSICGCEMPVQIAEHIPELLISILILLGCDTVRDIFGIFKKGE